MKKLSPKARSENGRIALIDAIKNPLGFFVLVVLVVEALLATLAALSRNSVTLAVTLIHGMLTVLILLIVIVAYLAWVRPEALMGLRQAKIPGVDGKWKYRCTTEITMKTGKKPVGSELQHGGICEISTERTVFGIKLVITGQRLWTIDKSGKYSLAQNWSASWGVITAEGMHFDYAIVTKKGTVQMHSLATIKRDGGKNPTSIEGEYYSLQDDAFSFGWLTLRRMEKDSDTEWSVTTAISAPVHELV
jgi:hypothetical protein